MVEPLSIASACAGLIATVAKTCIQIHTFVLEVREARKDMDSVTAELSSLSSCLENLRGTNLTKNCPRNLQETLINVMGECEKITRRMQKQLEKSTSSHGVVQGVQWATSGRKEMDKLRSSLAPHQITLQIALDLILLDIATSIKQDTRATRGIAASTKKDTGVVREIASSTKQDTGMIRKRMANITNNVSQIPELLDAVSKLSLDIQSLKNDIIAPPPYRSLDQSGKLAGSSQTQQNNKRPGTPALSGKRNAAKPADGKAVEKTPIAKEDPVKPKRPSKKRPSQDPPLDKYSAIADGKPGERSVPKTMSNKENRKNKSSSDFQAQDSPFKKGRMDKELTMQTQADQEHVSEAGSKRAKKKDVPKERPEHEPKAEKTEQGNSARNHTERKQDCTKDQEVAEAKSKLTKKKNPPKERHQHEPDIAKTDQEKSNRSTPDRRKNSAKGGGDANVNKRQKQSDIAL